MSAASADSAAQDTAKVLSGEEENSIPDHKGEADARSTMSQVQPYRLLAYAYTAISIIPVVRVASQYCGAGLL